MNCIPKLQTAAIMRQIAQYTNQGVAGRSFVIVPVDAGVLQDPTLGEHYVRVHA